MNNNEMGKVKFYNHSKGFGFIERESGDDLFVKLNGGLGGSPVALLVGQTVKFNVVNYNGNEQAENITIVEPTS